MKFYKLRVIENRDEILSCQKNLFNRLVEKADKEISGTVFAGRPIEGTIYWISDLGVWYMYRFIKGSRHWNVFGTGEPSTEKNNAIICDKFTTSRYKSQDWVHLPKAPMGTTT